MTAVAEIGGQEDAGNAHEGCARHRGVAYGVGDLIGSSTTGFAGEEAGRMGTGDAGKDLGRRGLLATVLRSRRRALGLSLQQVAQQAGCARSYLSMLETGARDGEVGAALLGRLERALALAPGALVDAAHWASTPASVRRRVKELEESQRAAAAALRSSIGPGAPGSVGGGLSLDEAYRSGRLHTLVRRLEDKAAPGLGRLGGDAGGRVAGPTAGVSMLLPVQVPLMNSVAAGYPREFTDLGYPARVADEYVRVPDVCDPDAFAARVVGDSMMPDYREGDIVVFSPARPLRSGMDCFVRLERDAETTFKRVFVEAVEEDAGGGAGEGGDMGRGVERVPEYLRLVALNSVYPPRRLHREDVAGIYPAVSVTRVIG